MPGVSLKCSGSGVFAPRSIAFRTVVCEAFLTWQQWLRSPLAMAMRSRNILVGLFVLLLDLNSAALALLMRPFLMTSLCSVMKVFGVFEAIRARWVLPLLTSVFLTVSRFASRMIGMCRLSVKALAGVPLLKIM